MTIFFDTNALLYNASFVVISAVAIMHTKESSLIERHGASFLTGHVPRHKQILLCN